MWGLGYKLKSDQVQIYKLVICEAPPSTRKWEKMIGLSEVYKVWGLVRSILPESKVTWRYVFAVAEGSHEINQITNTYRFRVYINYL